MLQVLPRDAKLGTTVEHVKQLRDDITSTTANSFKESMKDATKQADDRALRLEARMGSLEITLSKIRLMLESAQVQGGVARERGAGSASNESTVSGSRSTGSHGGSQASGE